MNNCGNCKTNQKCDCLCHKIPVYASNAHVYHRPPQLVEQEGNFKASQLANYKKRFPEMTDEQITKMYNDNLYT